METTLSITLIATNPDVRGGRPYLIGTTITVADIAIAKVFHQLEPEEIAENYRLTLPQVYAALAHYYDLTLHSPPPLTPPPRCAEGGGPRFSPFPPCGGRAGDGGNRSPA